ncbi:HAD-IA family hydrolase [bacterium AH-315-P15]|nr:HAD-IA family hydrolase [bacterium AH-315-P15]
MKIEAVIWDFGGVFTTSPFEAFKRYEAERGLPPDLIRSLNAANPDTNAWARFERSEISLAEFDAAFAAEARARGLDVPGRDVIALLHGDLRPEMVRALELCKKHLKTGCVTNNVKPAEGENFWEEGARAAQIHPVMEMFDHVIESAKVGLRKPDPRIYEMMCEALAVAPNACVYLDDLGINCKPARAMGMATIKVTSADQAIGELEEITGLKLR